MQIVNARLAFLFGLPVACPGRAGYTPAYSEGKLRHGRTGREGGGRDRREPRDRGSDRDCARRRRRRPRSSGAHPARSGENGGGSARERPQGLRCGLRRRLLSLGRSRLRGRLGSLRPAGHPGQQRRQQAELQDRGHPARGGMGRGRRREPQGDLPLQSGSRPPNDAQRRRVSRQRRLHRRPGSLSSDRSLLRREGGRGRLDQSDGGRVG